MIGVYPMNLDETCYFLAMDFDKDGWRKDIEAVRETSNEFGIPFAIERSRSGNGGHVWFFFEELISASIARRFGSSLLTNSMEKRHELSFQSYDRLFPDQDTMPKGGLGNLIALPLQMAARTKHNSVFLDENFQPYNDQWDYLSNVIRLSEEKLMEFTEKLSKGSELGILKRETVDETKPWVSKPIVLQKQDFPQTVDIVNSGMLYIKKEGLSPKALNSIKRFAAFKNPEFLYETPSNVLQSEEFHYSLWPGAIFRSGRAGYKKQAMRMPTFGVPRIISCSEDFNEYIALPRGCEKDVKDHSIIT